jgi:hypothetical protein
MPYRLSYGRCPPGPEKPCRAAEFPEQRDLLKAAESAQIHNFRWPGGVVLRGAGVAPKPRSDGIAAEVIATVSRPSY